MKQAKLLIFSFCVFPCLSFAAQITENFSSRDMMESATAVWNHGSGFVTPPLVVRGWEVAFTPQADVDVELGDGSHGAFHSGTWSQFSVSVDSTSKIIYLDTMAFPIFNFSSFHLPENWTIEPVGTNPLKIYVLGDMQVDGKIECSGNNGTNSTGNGAGAEVGLGGEGRCGGGRGGDGGIVYPGTGSHSGQNGTSPHTDISGGTGGATTGAGGGSGGGGGGSWANAVGNILSTAGTGGTAGARGAAVSDLTWTKIFGSAGGGGGSGSSNEAGGGGGAGGGVIILHVGGNLTVGVNGEILANGGNGGVGPGNAGGGGAGAGGSIQIWAGGTLTLLGIGNRAISADRGVRGNASGASAGDGGAGWEGRTWIAYSAFDNSAGASTIYPASQLSFEGDVRYTTGSAVEAVSKVFDVNSTMSELGSAQFLPASAGVQLEVAGSNDSFVSDDSGWVAAENVTQLNRKRYLRFRITLNNTDAVTPTRVDQVTIEYTAGARNEFDFKSSGCGAIGPVDPEESKGVGLALLLLMMPLLIWLQVRRQSPV